jgi:hypothetical protein
MGIPIAKGAVVGLYAFNSIQKYGASSDSVREFFAQQGINTWNIGTDQPVIIWDRLLAAGAFYLGAHFADKKVIPKFVSEKTLKSGTMGLLSA